MPSRCSRFLVGLHAASLCGVLVAQSAEPPKEVRLRTLWKFEAPAGQQVEHLVAHAGFVMVAFGQGSVAALRADDGSEVWRRKVGKQTVHGLVIAGEPKSVAIVLTVGKALGVLDLRSGEPRWIREMPHELAAPAIVGDLVVAGGADGNVHGRSLATGDAVWTTDYMKDAPADPPGFDGKVARYGDQVARPGPASSDGELVFFSVFDQCRALAVDARSGARKAAFPTRGWMFMKPVLSGDFVLVGSQDRHFRCFDKTNGKQVWSHETGWRVEAACAVRDERVYWGSCDGHVYCLGLAKGDLVWKQPIGSDQERGVPIYEPPVVTGKILLLPALSGEVIALDRETGRVLGRHRPAADSEIDGSAWDGSLLFVQTRRTLGQKGEEAVFAIGR
ncbi:MAG TPA: PQQ-binding-like beta-propeller repeat protein [Planctomycetota bacterium]